MTRIIVLLVSLIILGIGGIFKLYKTEDIQRPSYLVDTYLEYDLDLDAKEELIHFYTKELEFGNWKTEIYINNLIKPILIADDLLRSYNTDDISDNTRILRLETSAGGKLVNSLLYQYQNGKLIRVPVIKNSRKESWDIWSSSGVDFIDTDSDGIKEMLLYYRYYPSEAKRTVELYKFDGKLFHKIKEYKE